MTKSPLRCCAISCMVCMILFVVQAFSQNKQILNLADRYSSALRKLQKQGKRISIEGVLRKGKELSDKWEELEALDENEYLRLEKKMKGFLVNRQEVLFIEPDLKFFEKQSRKYGLSSDVAFFKLMQRIKPDSVWAAYIEQQTDVTGCTKYGSGLLTRLYGDLLRFKKAYPNKHVADINDEIGEILDEFSVSGCACGDIEEVLKEFRLFIKSYPRDTNRPKIKRNLTQIKKQGDFRPNCHSG
jgi:hypothetical protein